MLPPSFGPAGEHDGGKNVERRKNPTRAAKALLVLIRAT